MDLNQIKYFNEVAKSQNISKAAKSLFISQPSLSVSMSKLEAELGVPLFIRSGNSIKLSPAGSVMAEHTDKLLKKSRR